ncbi:MAG: hypothetical protein HY318_04125, partial [Armatimonadetes bacterium]|nr:hypothetical protein [Armatimonadota bacterium]
MATVVDPKSVLASLAVWLSLWCMSPLAVSADAILKRPRDNWDFKFKDFVIGAWWGPGPTEPEVKLYRECGFNVVMCGRYMQLNDYCDADKGIKELDLARKYGLGVVFDTYTKNDKPWGGKAGPYEPHPVHHPSSLIELQWLHEKIGRHPALIGYMVGDDQGSVGERSNDCTKFLFSLSKPHLMPWLCGWISPANLAEHNNPIVNPQIYPTLYQWGLPAEELARQYAATYASFSRQCRDLGVLFWPMFNAAPPNEREQVSDTLLRFPAYAALAYGAEGMWYFCYNGGSLQREGKYQTEEEVRKALTSLYPIAKKINHRIAAWGPKVLGRTSTGLFGTAFGAKEPAWPFPEDTAGLQSAEALVRPEKGKLVETMSDDLLVGLLTKPGRAPMAMVVDCRASKKSGDLQPRQVVLKFSPAVTQIKVLEGKTSKAKPGRQVRLTLEAGDGQMLELVGKDLESLCSAEAIYAPPPIPVSVLPRTPTEKDLAGIKAAKLRIDLFGSDGPPFEKKYLYLNGQNLARVP